MAETVDCSVPDCPTPTIVVPEIPPTQIPKIDIGDLDAVSDELKEFLSSRPSTSGTKRSKSLTAEELLSFLDFLKEKDEEKFMSLQSKTNFQSNDSREYLVVYCDSGHKNIVFI